MYRLGKTFLSNKLIFLGFLWSVYSVTMDVVVAQPGDCSEDAHCDDRFYCKSDHCVPCIDCNNYNREPPKTQPPCIESVTKCGGCLEGYLEDPSSNMLPRLCSTSSGVPTWVVITVPVVFMMLLCAIIIVALRQTKIVTNYRMSWMWRWVVGREPSELESRPPPYNAEAPPYYNNKYQGAPTCPNQWQMSQGEPLDREPPPYSASSVSPTNHGSKMSRDESDPLMKHSSPPTLLAEINATATPYNRPAPTYTHAPHLNEDEDNGLNMYSPANEMPDEETMESVWTPHPDDSVMQTEQRVPQNGEPVAASDVSGASGEGTTMSAQLAAARSAVLLQPPATRRPHHSPPSPEGGVEGGPSGSSFQHSNINITLNLNNFNHQHIAGYRARGESLALTFGWRGLQRRIEAGNDWSANQSTACAYTPAPHPANCPLIPNFRFLHNNGQSQTLAARSVSNLYHLFDYVNE